VRRVHERGAREQEHNYGPKTVEDSLRPITPEAETLWRRERR
jgi:hypothetical protein